MHLFLLWVFKQGGGAFYRVGQWYRHISYVFLGFIFLGTPFSATAHPVESNSPLQLTVKERAWLKNNPVIRVGIDPHFQPYEFFNEQGRHSGISQEYLHLLSKQLGIVFKVVPFDSWSEVIKASKAKQVDILSAVIQTPKRLQFLNFTKPYTYFKAAIVTQWDSYQVNRIEDLANQPVVLVKDYALSELALAKEPSIQPIYVDTILDGLKAISNHQAVAIISDLGSVSYKIRQYKMNNLEVAGLVDTSAKGVAIAVRKDWPVFRHILDKALANISEQQRQKILHRWIPIEHKPQLIFSQHEQQFLKEHSVIHVGIDPEFAPFEFIDEQGQYRGMTSDYIHLLSQRLGVRFEIKQGITWDKAVEQAKRKQLDVLPAVGMTTERQQYFIYSKPYIQFHRVIISRLDTPFLRGMNDIKSLRVAVQKNSSHEGFLKAYPSIQLMTFSTLQKTLQAVSNGKADVLIGNIASCSYWIRKMNLTNLKVAAAASETPQNLHFAVRNDWPELVSVINKALDSISLLEHQRISEKWVSIHYDPVTDYTLLWKYIAAFVLITLLLLMWVLYIQRQRCLLQTARNEALAANEELKMLQANLEQLVEERTQELIASERRFRQAQKMEAMGTLVSGIVHDFNNVLSGMIGMVQLAKAKTQGAEQDELLDSACEQGFQAADMIKQLMRFAHQESTEKNVFSLNNLLAQSKKIMKVATRNCVNISFSLCDEDLKISANHSQIQQVLFNLVNNAGGALEDTSDARIEVSLRHFFADDVWLCKQPDISGHDFACIEIKDNGDGIAAEHLERIFDPFFTTKPTGKGTGLGLAMVYGTIQEHGGTIMVKSQPHQGSTFTIYLPLIDKT